MKRSLRLISTILAIVSLNLIVPVVSAKSNPCDINGDGYVTSEDARLTLRFAAGMETPTEEQKDLADKDNDGVITYEDVKYVMKEAIRLETYEVTLLRKGFPMSYVEPLVELHEEYPNWEFEPMLTGLDWQKSIDGERDPHKQQLIENNVKASYKCSCKSCKGVIQEASNWVSASEEAVKYYMDPRNFLDEEYIFQFESTAYDKTHTKAGVEAILKNTWMHDSSIKYLNTVGDKKTYKENGKAVKYSDVILKAAKESGMSAYYLASKIVQEVGSNTASYAGGSSGENAPYYGIYNYYNIGAYTGVADGLKWANGFMKTSKKTTMYKSNSSTSGKVKTIPSGTELNYISTKGKYYRVRAKVSGKTYKGYIKKNAVSAYTSYGRPWTNPAKSIYNGAQYIYDSFSETQYTGYLQKFNVNPKSENVYNHEYMANVRAAAAEAVKTHDAYVSADILKTKKVFSIPVFENMPGADYSELDYFKKSKPKVSVTDYTSSSVTLSWTSLENAENYQVFKYDTETKKYKRIKTTSKRTYTDKGLSSGDFPKYKVRAYRRNKSGDKVYSAYSSVFEATVTPEKISGLKVVSKGKSSVKLDWKGVSKSSGYLIYRYDDFVSKYEKVGTSTESSFTDKTVESGTEYKYKIKTYTKTDSRTFYSGYSSVVTAKTSGTAPERKAHVSITDGVLNIRESASTSADVIAKLTEGHSVTILGISGDWFKVKFTYKGESYTGYGSVKYIKLGKYSPECPYAEPDYTLSEGNSGDAVRWLQWHLYKLDYLEKDDIDGSFGPTTLAAVKKFQKAKDLEVDGLVGSGTREALKKAVK